MQARLGIIVRLLWGEGKEGLAITMMELTEGGFEPSKAKQSKKERDFLEITISHFVSFGS
jgi:hypothetical protein